MELDEFVDGFFMNWSGELEDSRISRAKLENTYIALQGLGLTDSMTPEHAEIIYSMCTDWYHQGSEDQCKAIGALNKAQ